jgi:hypothetical protein
VTSSVGFSANADVEHATRMQAATLDVANWLRYE